MTENNQFVFVVNEIIDRHNRYVANKIVKIHRRRETNFNISQNDENNIDSNLDFLHVEISIKRALQNIIATINNQFTKQKKKRFKDFKNIARSDALSRVDFNALLYAFC